MNAFSLRAVLLGSLFAASASGAPLILDPAQVDAHLDVFREEDRWYFNVATDAAVSQVNHGTYGGQWVKNAAAADYLRTRIPLLDVPDAALEKTWYYRWWAFRKHIKNIGTPVAPDFIITEYIDPVPWADSTNAIVAPVGHQLYEARWLDDPQVSRDYIRYWMTHAAANPRRYSAWLADATLARHLVMPDDALVTEMVSSPTNRLTLDSNWQGWVLKDSRPGGETQQASYDAADRLFWQNDDRDAMEVSYGGSGKRPSINSYLYGDARATAEMYRIAARHQPAQAATHLASATRYDGLAEDLREAVQTRLWDESDEFFKTGYGSGGNDGPSSSADSGTPRHTWWAPDHLGTSEWVQYDFASPVTVDRCEVYFYDDRPHGGTRVPGSWELQYWNGTAWQPCVRKPGQTYAVERDVYNGVAIEPVTTSRLRLAASLQPGFSAGTLEWRVFSTGGANVSLAATPSASYTDIYGGTVAALNDEGRYPVQDRREQIGFTPWYFGLPEKDAAVDYDRAWSHLWRFTTSHGLTSGATDEAGYQTGQLGSCCQWNGPVWPFATTITLKAMARLLHEHQQPYVTRGNYLDQLKTYSDSHRFTLTRGSETRTLSWIDESMTSAGPGGGLWTHIGGNGVQPGNAPRGFSYNHSGFADLVITGLIGLKPRADDIVEVAPLVPLDAGGGYVWDHFCLDQVAYRGHQLTILYDKTGLHYGAGQGLHVFADGIRIASSPSAGAVQGVLPDAIQRWAAPFFPGHPDQQQLAADADPDGDGSDNLLEYLSATDPSSSSSIPSTRVWIAPVDGQPVDSAKHLHVEAIVRETPQNITLQPQLSASLADWETGSLSVVELPAIPRGDGTVLRRFRSADPVSSVDAAFFRFRATLPVAE
ncbi:hypothetical protein OKA04_12100 [Luteolibacter flavescens]|uniref:Mannosylglycerate hydrolase MGH1-like glycoside hydrolase domain-containing protein n=1 Tax=Luteolibacter flavescens TaxID=1859460 RepID=A0ABT3FPH6_9BACT|nr:hypothetical protein [Luteolibacter flavescens]MCW1885473.1 hypothetical protein [Luteolibacter flavescens]